MQVFHRCLQRTSEESEKVVTPAPEGIDGDGERDRADLDFVGGGAEFYSFSMQCSISTILRLLSAIKYSMI